MNKRSGKTSPLLLIAAVLAVVVVALLLLPKGDSETQAAADFMTALGKGDVQTLTRLSYLDGETPESISKAWEKTLGYSKYYRFAWSVDRSLVTSPTEAAVTLKMYPDFGKSSSYEQKQELPMKKVNGKWLVDVRAISSAVYPSLPQ